MGRGEILRLMFSLLHILLFKAKLKCACSYTYCRGSVKFGKELQWIDQQLDQITTLKLQCLKSRSNIFEYECVDWSHINLNNISCGGFFLSVVPSPVPLVFAFAEPFSEQSVSCSWNVVDCYYMNHIAWNKITLLAFIFL